MLTPKKDEPASYRPDFFQHRLKSSFRRQRRRRWRKHEGQYKGPKAEDALTNDNAVKMANLTEMANLEGAYNPVDDRIASTLTTTVAPDSVTAGSQLNLTDYRLTPERIKAHCNGHNIILATHVNSKQLGFAYTWASHVYRLRLSNYLVGATDHAALRKLVGRSIHAFDMFSGLTVIGGELSPFCRGRCRYRFAQRPKLELILSLLRAGADPVIIDVDALITRDPSPFIVRLLPEAQILVASSNLFSSSSNGDFDLEDPQHAVRSPWNTGYMYLRHDVLASMLYWQSQCYTYWDGQHASAQHSKCYTDRFKDVLQMGGFRLGAKVPESARLKRLFLGYNGTIRIGILPVSTFCSGHTYFVQRMPQSRGLEPYAVQTTFQHGYDTVGKTHRLREAMLWAEEPSYFTPWLSSGLAEGGSAAMGFLSYTAVVQRALLKPAGVMDVASHLQLVHLQLTQIRAALLLARQLQRILILPQLVCGLDSFWFPHNGTFPGSDTTLPIEPCPADRVLDLNRIARKHGGHVESVLREASFLDNPQLPHFVRKSRQVLSPPTDLGERALGALRTPALRDTRVLHFSSMPNLYATLPPSEAESEQRRMRDWTTFWCCSWRGPKRVGHVWYDFFWDVVPHTNRFWKSVSRPLEVSFGP